MKRSTCNVCQKKRYQKYMKQVTFPEIKLGQSLVNFVNTWVCKEHLSTYKSKLSVLNGQILNLINKI